MRALQAIMEGGAALPRLAVLGDGPPSHLKLARACLQKGYLLEAMEEAVAAVRLDPDLHLAHFALAEALARRGRHDQAEAEYLRAAQLAPRFAEARARLGDLLAQCDRPAQAIEAYRSALAIDPSQAGLHLKIGTIQFRQREFQAAIESYQTALKIDPNLGRAGHTLGDYSSLMITVARCQAPIGVRERRLSPPGAPVVPGKPAPHPALRPDLTIVPLATEDGDPGGSLMKDPASQAIYELGELESFICKALDGQTPIEIVRERAEGLFEVRLPLENTAGFLDQLVHLGLVAWGAGGAPAAALAAGPRAAPETAAPSKDAPRLPRRTTLGRILTWPFRALVRGLVVGPWDLVTLRGWMEVSPPRKVALFCPERFLRGCARLLSFCFTRTFVCATVPLIATGLYLFVDRWHDFWFEEFTVWRPGGYLLLAAVGILGVHVPHQLAHGMVVARHGGRVRACGIRLLFHVVPTFYCDMSDALWLRQKRQKLWAVFVGIHYQLLAFSVGTFVWAQTVRGTFWHAFFLTLASAAFWGLAFNANPAIKRDMYCFLSAWLEIPDLRERALDRVRSWVRWLRAPEPLTRRERNWFVTYALVACLYGLTHGLITSWLFFHRMTGAFNGRGAVVFMICGTVVFQDHVRYYLGRPIGWLRSLWTSWLRRLVISVTVAALMVGIGLIPYPYHTGGPITLQPVRRLDVRTELEGLVEKVYVHEGQWVEAGQKIARLVKRNSEKNLKAVEAQIEQRRAQLRLLKAGPKPEEIAMARQAVETARTKVAWSGPRAVRYQQLHKDRLVSDQDVENALRQRDVDAQELAQAQANLKLISSGARPEQIQAMESEIESLKALAKNYREDVRRTVLFSPIAGRIITPHVESLLGVYLKPGQRDLVVQVEDARTLRAEVEVPEEDAASIRAGAEVEIALWTFHDVTFRGKVVSIAPIASASAPQSPYSAAAGDVATSQQVTMATSSWQVVRVVTEIPNPDGYLKSDMTGFAKIATEHRPVWDVLLRPFIRWCKVEVWYWIP